ncbi:MAG TPA: tetratricopeptide repeat protein, partial [Chthoniobacteraceae bacterium]
MALLVAIFTLAILLTRGHRHSPQAGKSPAPSSPAATATNDPRALEEEALRLQEKGDYSGAEPLFRQCLAIRRKTFGPEDIDTLAAMNNLGNLLHDRGRNSEAAAIHRECLQIRERTLGADHPHTLASL